jgi:hypothetical protein
MARGGSRGSASRLLKSLRNRSPKWWRSRIAVLTSLAWITGAIVGFGIVILREHAADADRRAASEQVQVAQKESLYRAYVANQAMAFARYRAKIEEARKLRQSRDMFDHELAKDISYQAHVARKEATMLRVVGFNMGYVEEGDFDEASALRDLVASDSQLDHLDPEAARGLADSKRARSVGTTWWLMFLSGAVVLYAFARVVPRRLTPYFVAFGALAYLSAVVGTLITVL